MGALKTIGITKLFTLLTFSSNQTKNKIKDISGDRLLNTDSMTDQQLHDQKVLDIAIVCHEANRMWCEANKDFSQRQWMNAEKWQQDSAIKGVQFRLDNPDAKEDSQHNAWMADKVNDGWVYGETKDPELKTHPCIVPFNELPEFQQKKDKLFCVVVDALK